MNQTIEQNSASLRRTLICSYHYSTGKQPHLITNY